MKFINTHRIAVTIVSVTKTLDDLKREGYQSKFRREPTGLCCIGLKVWITPEQFSVDNCYYYEDISNPDADRVLYAITTSLGIKGILVETCGAYMDNISEEMIEKLKFKKLRQASTIMVTNFANAIESW
ncbi:hypothetical protein [Flavitalea sp.]|nr:hypothetical protein [Flavitalea sp.]